MFNDTSKVLDRSEAEATVSAIITGERAPVRSSGLRARADMDATAEPEMPFGEEDHVVQVAPHKSGKKGFAVKIDHSRDALLTAFGKATLTDRYLMPGESYQDLFARVASYYADDAAHCW